MNVKVNEPDWNLAPPEWDWRAQDEDGRWFWYAVKPLPSLGGGVWRAPARAQQFAQEDRPNQDWINTLAQRPQ